MPYGTKANAGKARININANSIAEISSKKWSFGFITRAFFHEFVHVQVLLNRVSLPYGSVEDEVRAHYAAITLSGTLLPNLTKLELQGNCRTALNHIRIGSLPLESRAIFVTTYKTEVK
jgi:hypothetical protein